MMFTLSEGVKLICKNMVDYPENWKQDTHYFSCKSDIDLRIWTSNGVFFIQLGGNSTFSLREKFYIAKNIKQSIANRLKNSMEKTGENENTRPK